MKAIDLINWNTVSKTLTGNPDFLRKSWVGTDKMPPKYRKQITELLAEADKWILKF